MHAWMSEYGRSSKESIFITLTAWCMDGLPRRVIFIALTEYVFIRANKFSLGLVLKYLFVFIFNVSF